MRKSARLPLALLVLAFVVLVVSGVGPKERSTWWMEVAPVLLAAPILVATWRRFPLTPLVYALLFVHACILCLGGHYTYAEVPLGFWMRDTFHFARNHYDRIGHFAQGFVPALVCREVLVRKQIVRGRGWTAFVVVCICLAASAFYEFIEWWAAIFTSDGATAFLGTQGDPWDTQWDMFMCFIGANVAMLALSRVQDRQMARLEQGS
jgi:putative membrane protein